MTTGKALSGETRDTRMGHYLMALFFPVAHVKA